MFRGSRNAASIASMLRRPASDRTPRAASASAARSEPRRAPILPPRRTTWCPATTPPAPETSRRSRHPVSRSRAGLQRATALRSQTSSRTGRVLPRDPSRSAARRITSSSVTVGSPATSCVSARPSPSGLARRIAHTPRAHRPGCFGEDMADFRLQIPKPFPRNIGGAAAHPTAGWRPVPGASAAGRCRDWCWRGSRDAVASTARMIVSPSGRQPRALQRRSDRIGARQEVLVARVRERPAGRHIPWFRCACLQHTREVSAAGNGRRVGEVRQSDRRAVVSRAAVVMRARVPQRARGGQPRVPRVAARWHRQRQRRSPACSPCQPGMPFTSRTNGVAFSATRAGPRPHSPRLPRSAARIA